MPGSRSRPAPPARGAAIAVFIGKRLLHGVLVVWGAFTLAFLILDVIPGNPVRLMLSSGGDQSYVSQQQVDKISAQYGFNKPLDVQYLVRLGDLLHGDLGRSVQTGQPVTHVVLEALPPTLALMGCAVVIGVLLGGAVGFFGTYVRWVWLRELLLSLPSFGASMPTFWTALLLLEVLSFRIRAFPAFGSNGPASLVLPAVTLGIAMAATVGQVFARSMSTTSALPYVQTAQGKGASRLRIHVVHVTRNALAPAVTIAGVAGGRLLAGAVVVETIFGRSGLGSLTVTAVEQKDLDLVLGIVVINAALFVLISLIVDLTYPLIDPRQQLSTRWAARAALPDSEAVNA